MASDRPLGAGRGLPPPGQEQRGQAEKAHGGQPLEQRHAVFGDDHLGQVVGDEGNLVSHAHENKSADQDVKRRVSWDQDQNPPGVGRQPDVVLTYEQLGETERLRSCGMKPQSCRG